LTKRASACCLQASRFVGLLFALPPYLTDEDLHVAYNLFGGAAAFAGKPWRAHELRLQHVCYCEGMMQPCAVTFPHQLQDGLFMKLVPLTIALPEVNGAAYDRKSVQGQLFLKQAEVWVKEQRELRVGDLLDRGTREEPRAPLFIPLRKICALDGFRANLDASLWVRPASGEDDWDEEEYIFRPMRERFGIVADAAEQEQKQAGNNEAARNDDEAQPMEIDDGKEREAEEDGPRLEAPQGPRRGGQPSLPQQVSEREAMGDGPRFEAPQGPRRGGQPSILEQVSARIRALENPELLATAIPLTTLLAAAVRVACLAMTSAECRVRSLLYFVCIEKKQLFVFVCAAAVAGEPGDGERGVGDATDERAAADRGGGRGAAWPRPGAPHEHAQGADSALPARVPGQVSRDVGSDADASGRGDGVG